MKELDETFIATLIFYLNWIGPAERRWQCASMRSSVFAVLLFLSFGVLSSTASRTIVEQHGDGVGQVATQRRILADDSDRIARVTKQCEGIQSSAKLFVDQAEWQAALASHQACPLQHSKFRLDQKNLMLSDEIVTFHSISQALTFVKSKTGIPLDFVFQILPTGSNRQDVRSTMAMDSLSVGGKPSDEHPEVHQSDNDDFQITLNTQGGIKAYAVGFELLENHLTKGESVSIMGLGDRCLGRFMLEDSKISPKSSSSQFVGLISEEPISSLLFDEVRTLPFARDAHARRLITHTVLSLLAASF